jgi:nicotinamide riboside kinase
MKRVVVTGPESTGKTTLVRQLSEHFHCLSIGEYAREYLNKLDKSYCQGDLLQIAEGQLKRYGSLSKDSELVVADTDLLTIKIWSEFKYGNCDPWISQTLENHLPDLYLICYPDLAWEYYSQRENPNDGMELFEIYLAEIKKLGVPFHIIKGVGEQRLNNGVKAVGEIIS